MLKSNNPNNILIWLNYGFMCESLELITRFLGSSFLLFIIVTAISDVSICLYFVKAMYDYNIHIVTNDNGNKNI